MPHATNRPRLPRSALYLVALVLLFPWTSTGADNIAEGDDLPVKFGFTRSMFVDLNEADTRAAVKSYALLLASNNELTVSDAPAMLENTEAVRAAFANGTADIISMTTTEFYSLPTGSTHPRMIAANMGGNIQEHYVLLVRNDSGFKTLADLKNKRLLIYGSLRGSLSPLWLDVLLADNNLPEPRNFFGTVSSVHKPSRTVLPLFFHQADACVVTQTGYNVICELNPQIAKQLTTIATSPGIIPTVTCFRAGIPSRSSERILKAVVDAQHTVSGRQVLTIFQCDSIVEISPAQIENVRELIATRDRLRRPPPSSAAAQATTELQSTAIIP